LNFTLRGVSDELLKDYRFRDKKGNDLTDAETILFVNLPWVDSILAKPVEELTGSEMWALFLRYITDSSKRALMETIIKKEEGIEMAASILYEISQDEATRIQYENELLGELDARSWAHDAWQEGREEGREEGRQEGREEGVEIGLGTAMRIMQDLHEHLPVGEIAARHHLPIEKIEEIQAALTLLKA
jgi:predicted transposase/invertase (TIGR01784 family)